MADDPVADPSEMGGENIPESSPSRRNRWLRKGLVFLAVVAVFLVAYFQFGQYLSLDYLSGVESELRETKENHLLWVVAVAFLVYVSVTGLSVPGATGLSLACGWFFGFWQGVLFVSFASTTGATLAFLLSRYLFRDAILNRFGDRLAGFNAALEREGAFYLFTLRLIPAVPFFVINVVMGLTPMRVRTYWWVSQVGMFPGTCVYVYAGSQVPSLKKLADDGIRGILTPQMIGAFILLGLFPIVVKKIMGKLRPPLASHILQ